MPVAPALRPIPYEVWTREDGDAKVVHVFSPSQAEQIREQLREQGIDAALFIGDMEIE